MGGLRKPMPITYLTAVIGTLALVGFPGFSGFFSKDAIIEAVHLSTLAGSGLAYIALTASVFITAFYSFRLLFLTFHGRPRMDQEIRRHVKESPWVVTVPLVLLAIPSVVIGAWYVEPMLFGGFFGDSIKVLPAHDTLAQLAREDPESTGVELLIQLVLHGVMAPPFWLFLVGAVSAWIMYIDRPELPDKLAKRFDTLYRVLMNKYGFDEFNEFVIARGARRIGQIFWKIWDDKVIDGWMINGTARMVGLFSSIVRQIQTGYVYHYAFAMIIGLFLLMTLFLKP